MKFSRIALLDAVNAAIADGRTSHERNVQTWEKLVEQSKVDWVGKYNTRWKYAADVITAYVEAGRPITAELLVHEPRYTQSPILWSEPYYGPGDIRKPSKTYTPPSELTSMRATLMAITDDEVTPSGLRNLGFTSAMLQRVIHWMGRVG